MKYDTFKVNIPFYGHDLRRPAYQPTPWPAPAPGLVRFAVAQPGGLFALRAKAGQPHPALLRCSLNLWWYENETSIKVRRQTQIPTATIYCS